MSNQFEKLNKRVLKEVRDQRRGSTNVLSSKRARILGLFLQESLKNSGYSREDFAQALDIELELADAILDGILPAAELNDDLLADIARVLNYEPNVLTILLNSQSVSIPGSSEGDAPSSTQSPR